MFLNAKKPKINTSTSKQRLSNNIVSGVLVALVFAALLFSSTQLARASADAAATATEWPTFNGDVAHSGFNVGSAPDNNYTFWALSGVGGYQSIPVVDSDKVFTGSTNGNISAVDVQTGHLFWTYHTTPHVDQPPRLTVAYGMVFACSYPESKVYALNETTGHWIWVFEASGVLGCCPTAANGLLYVPSQGGYFYALNATTGAQNWEYPIGTATAVPSVADGEVFVADWSGFFAALNDITGQVIWTTNFPGVLATSPVVSDGKVFIVQGAPTALYAINETTGTWIWKYTPSGNTGSGGATPVVIYGKVYFSSTGQNQVIALDENAGFLIWQSTPGPYDALRHYGDLAVADGKVFAPVGSHLFELNATTGTTLWSYNMGGYYSQIEGMDTSGDCPALADGYVFIGAGNYLFAIGGNQDNTTPVLPTPTPPPAPLPTPSASTLSLYCTSTTSLNSFTIQISGNLTQNGTGIPNAQILLSYSVTGGATWIDLTSVSTDANGGFLAVWTPAVTGNYQIKAGYAGNAAASSAETTTYLAVVPSAEQQNLQVFSVASNSTVTDLAYNSTSQQLCFTVSGQSGTKGYVDISIKKTLLPDPSNLRVYLDGQQLNFSSTQTSDSWIIYFTYHHSTHTVVLSLSGATQPKPSIALISAAVAVVAIVAILSAIAEMNLKKRKQ